jgi:hypothetical protein
MAISVLEDYLRITMLFYLSCPLSFLNCSDPGFSQLLFSFVTGFYSLRPGWSQIYNPPASTTKCWDYRYVLPHPAYTFLLLLKFDMLSNPQPLSIHYSFKYDKHPYLKTKQNKSRPSLSQKD